MLAKIVIIGAGPAGLLLAHYLLRRGKYQVEIYDRRPDPREVNLSQKRTFPISLQERGRRALREIEGLESAVLSQGQLIQKTIRYRPNKKPNQTSRKQPLFSIDRTEIVLWREF